MPRVFIKGVHLQQQPTNDVKSRQIIRVPTYAYLEISRQPVLCNIEVGLVFLRLGAVVRLQYAKVQMSQVMASNTYISLTTKS